MHFLVAWDAPPEHCQELGDHYRASLVGESFIEPIEAVCIVRVESMAGYNELAAKFARIAESIEFPHRVLVSPAMSDGTAYQGWLPSETWEEINRKTLLAVDEADSPPPTAAVG